MRALLDDDCVPPILVYVSDDMSGKCEVIWTRSMTRESRQWIVLTSALYSGELSDTDSPTVGTRDTGGASVPISVIASAVCLVTKAWISLQMRDALDKL